MNCFQKRLWLHIAATLIAVSPAIAQTKANANDGPIKPTIATNLAQLCRIRELELVQMSNVLRGQLAELAAAKDPKKQADLGVRYQATKNLLVDMEQSWQRLNCTGLLYGYSKDFIGR